MARSQTEKWFEATVGGGLAGVPAAFLTAVTLGLLPLKDRPWFTSAVSIIALSVGLFTMWAVSRRLAKQSEVTQPGCCPQCGYDLRGNATGICSECGTGIHVS